MIVTPSSVAFGFVCLIGLLIGLVLVVATVPRLWRARPGRTGLEDSLVLGLVLGQSLLASQLLAWPLLYATMVSYVPLTRGAMCVFGVTQKAPWIVHSLEVLQPTALVMIGALVALLGVRRAGQITVSGRLVVGHVVACALISTATSTLGLAYLMGPKDTQPVSCCGAIFASPDRFSAVATGLFLGSKASTLILPVAVWLSALLAWVVVWIELSKPGTVREVVAALLAVFLSGASVLSLFETVAPTLLDRPTHHCAYCLLNPRNSPLWLSLPALICLWLATAIPVWRAWLAIAAPDSGAFRSRGWTVLVVLSLLAFWSIVLVPYSAHPVR